VEELPVEDRYLRSLVENVARLRKTPLDVARDLLAQRKRGRTIAEIAANVGLSEKYVGSLIRLLENGEERLVTAVERGEMPITVAIEISLSDDASIARVLQQAYESGELRGNELHRARRLIEERNVRGKALRPSRAGVKQAPSTHDLVRALRKEAQRQELIVKKSELCDQQIRFVVSGLKTLLADDYFITLMRGEDLAELPEYLQTRVSQS
jgi:ParB family chromosome partitioning protein